MKKLVKFIYVVLTALLVFQCNNDDTNSQYTPPDNPNLSHPNDTYLYDNNGNSLFEVYGTATRWRWNDNFIDPDQRATPIESDFVIPATKLIEYLWVEPFTDLGISGEKLMEDFFPPEVVYIGSRIFQEDGSALLGFAEGGARITILDLNKLDFQDRNWLVNPRSGILATVHHEFSHIIQQRFGNPVGLNTISENYIGIDWINRSREDAIKLGMVSAYGASSEFEDFAEIISHFLVIDQQTFEQDFITQVDCSTLTDPAAIANCRELNEGRLLIQQKLDLILDYYDTQSNIDLVQVRDILQERLDNLIATGVIPD